MASHERLTNPKDVANRDRGSIETALGRRYVLVVGQIAVSQFLLVGAVLLVRSYLNVQAVRPGFRQDGNILFAQLAPAAAVEGNPMGPAAFRELAERLRGLPGVVEVSGAAGEPG